MEKRVYEVPMTEQIKLNVQSILIVGSVNGESLGDGGSGSAGGGAAHSSRYIIDDELEAESNVKDVTEFSHSSLWD